MDEIRRIPVSDIQNQNASVERPSKQGSLIVNEEDLIFTLFDNIQLAADQGNQAAAQAVKANRVEAPILSAPPRTPRTIPAIRLQQDAKPAVATTIQRTLHPEAPLVPELPIPSIPNSQARDIANSNGSHNVPQSAHQAQAPSEGAVQTPNNQQSVTANERNSAVTFAFDDQAIQDTIINQKSDARYFVAIASGQQPSNASPSHFSPEELKHTIFYNTKTNTAVISQAGYEYYQQNPEALKQLNLPKGATIHVLSDAAWKSFTENLDEAVKKLQNNHGVDVQASIKSYENTLKRLVRQFIRDNATPSQDEFSRLEGRLTQTLAQSLHELFHDITLQNALERIQEKREEQREALEKEAETQLINHKEITEAEIKARCDKMQVDFLQIKQEIINDIVRGQQL